MGVDAQFCVTVKEPLSKEEVRQLAWELHSRFDEWIDTSHYTNEELKFSYGAVEVYDPKSCIYENDFGDDTQLLDIHTMCRFYGEYYERGPILPFIAMAELIERLVPTARVWYGGDCHSEIYPFNQEEREKIKNHFYAVGHASYRSTGQKCPECKNLLDNSGYVDGAEIYHCCLDGYFALVNGSLKHREKNPFAA